jgi:hypothetical protein
MDEKQGLDKDCEYGLCMLLTELTNDLIDENKIKKDVRIIGVRYTPTLYPGVNVLSAYTGNDKVFSRVSDNTGKAISEWQEEKRK